MSIGKNIKNRRIELKISQDQLAEKLFVTRQTISNYENGKSNPSIETLQQLSTILNCELDELLYGSRNNARAPKKKYIIIFICLFFIYMLIESLLPALEAWSNETYHISTLVLARFYLIYPVLLMMFGYYIIEYLKTYNIKVKKIPHYKVAHKILVAICCFYIIACLPYFIGYALTNIANYKGMFMFVLKYKLLHLVPSLLMFVLAKFSILSPILWLSFVGLGMMISYTREE